jgi:hypothetical protein
LDKINDKALLSLISDNNMQKKRKNPEINIPVNNTNEINSLNSLNNLNNMNNSSVNIQRPSNYDRNKLLSTLSINNNNTKSNIPNKISENENKISTSNNNILQKNPFISTKNNEINSTPNINIGNSINISNPLVNLKLNQPMMKHPYQLSASFLKK